jgi:drug/metabolite transporter (DMT)-like permease
LIIRGVVGGIGVYRYYLTIVHLGAGRATFISNTYVVMGALLAVAFPHELAGAALTFGGTLLTLLPA